MSSSSSSSDDSEEEQVPEIIEHPSLQSQLFEFSHALQAGVVGISKSTTAHCCTVLQDCLWTGEENGFVNIWNATSFHRIVRFRAHKKTINASATVLHRVWLASDDGTISIWSGDYTRASCFPAHSGEPIDSLLLTISSHQYRVWSCSLQDQSLICWDTDSYEMVTSTKLGDNVSPCTLAYTHPLLFIGTAEGFVYTYDVDKMEVAENWRAHDGLVSAIIHFTVNQQIWTASTDMSIKCWRMMGSKESPERTLLGHSYPITKMERVGHLFAISGDTKGFIFLWGSSPQLFPSCIQSHSTSSSSSSSAPHAHLQSLYAVKDRKSWPSVCLFYWKDTQLNSNILVALDNHSMTFFSPLDIMVLMATDEDDVMLKEYLEKSVKELTRPDYYAGGFYRPLDVYRPSAHKHSQLAIAHSLPSSAPRANVSKLDATLPSRDAYSSSRMIFIRESQAESEKEFPLSIALDGSDTRSVPMTQDKKVKKSEGKKKSKKEGSTRNSKVKQIASTPEVKP